jgi:hypothetical protein
MSNLAIRLPFCLIAGNVFSSSVTIAHEIHGRKVVLYVQGDLVKIVAYEFNSADEAANFMYKAWISVIVHSIEASIGIAADFSQIIIQPESDTKPEILNSFNDFHITPPSQILGIHPAIYPYSWPEPTTRVFAPLIERENKFDIFNAGFIDSLRNSLNIQDHEKQGKINTALELYNSCLFETSKKSQFLTLVTALELLSDRGDKKSIIANELVNSFYTAVDDELKNKHLDDVTKQELNSLKSAASDLLKLSIGKSVRALVIEKTQGRFSNETVKIYAQKIEDIYHLRSGLTHGKNVDHDELRKAILDAKSILKILFNVILFR